MNKENRHKLAFFLFGASFGIVLVLLLLAIGLYLDFEGFVKGAERIVAGWMI